MLLINIGFTVHEKVLFQTFLNNVLPQIQGTMPKYVILREINFWMSRISKTMYACMYFFDNAQHCQFLFQQSHAYFPKIKIYSLIFLKVDFT